MRREGKGKGEEDRREKNEESVKSREEEWMKGRRRKGWAGVKQTLLLKIESRQ